MKKQIFILTMLTIALILSTSSYIFGQDPNPELDHLDVGGTVFCPTANTLICADGDGLSPVPGVSYTYEISVNSLSTVHWLVTDAANIMTAPGTLTTTFDIGDGTGEYLLLSDGVYNNATNTSASINLTWKSFNGTANNVLLVAYAVNEDGCTDNIEVYRIVPQYSFTLDLAAIFDSGAEGATECVGSVQSATYDGTNLNVIYGNNYVFFAVNAANWQDSWRPALSAASDFGNSTITSVEWAYPVDATTGGAWNGAGTEVLATNYTSHDNGFIGQTGACIIVRVLVTHGAATENLSDETITLSANGEMINPETLAYDGAYLDLDEGATSSDPCVNNFTDTFEYIITPRPTLTEVAPSPFETKVPTGN